VIVIGGGLAGMAAAEQAVRAGATTAVVCKGRIGEVGVRGSGASGCGATEAGVPAFFRMLDKSFDAHDFHDRIIDAGLGMVSREMVSLFVEEFVRMRPEAAEIMGSYGAGCSATLGTPLIHRSLGFVREHAKILEGTRAVRLVSDSEVCSGVICVDETSGVAFELCGKAVVLAAGGDAHLFSVNVHPQCVCGDGYALGLKAGAAAINLEFMQMFTMTTAPTRNLIHFWQERFLADLRNADGKEFLAGYLPENITVEQCIRENVLHAPFSVRDEASRYLAIAIVEEIKAGRGTDSGGVYVDLRECADFRGTRQDKFLRERAIDASAAPVEVSVGFQCCNGGLLVNTRMETTVAGLYAAGENAGGLHGADRLGGNMLAGCIISGRIAGREAAGHVPRRSPIKPLRFERQGSDGTENELSQAYGPLFTEIRRSAWENLLVVKSERSIEMFRDRLEQVRQRSRAMAVDSGGMPAELENLLVVGEVLAETSLERRESRGGFYREDYPNAIQAAPEAHIVTLSEDGRVLLRKETLDPQWNPDSRDGLGNVRWG